MAGELSGMLLLHAASQPTKHVIENPTQVLSLEKDIAEQGSANAEISHQVAMPSLNLTLSLPQT